MTKSLSRWQMGKLDVDGESFGTKYDVEGWLVDGK